MSKDPKVIERIVRLETKMEAHFKEMFNKQDLTNGRITKNETAIQKMKLRFQELSIWVKGLMDDKKKDDSEKLWGKREWAKWAMGIGGSLLLMYLAWIATKIMYILTI